MNKYAHKDLAGQKFSRLTVIKYTEKRQNGCVVWLCRCDCGNLIWVRSSSLCFGNTKSCGCLKIEKVRVGNRLKHGCSRKDKVEQLYKTWLRIKNRCSNPNNDRYEYYGKRGIQVCPEWLNNYPAFKVWALANGYKPGLSIDRINNNGNYSPENCQWLTSIENIKKSHRDTPRNTLGVRGFIKNL